MNLRFVWALPAILALMLAACGEPSTPVDECSMGETRCDDGCFNIMTDANHCGSCTTACNPGELCALGSCVTECPGGTTDCSGACVDLSTDLTNCGACGNACMPGEVCSVGTCASTCPAGSVECAGICRDIQTDRFNCGGCGNTCAAGEVCSDGECGIECGMGTELCDNRCVDTDTDRFHCGGCGTECAAGELCSDGACSMNCGGGTPTLCGDRCVDTMTDANFCGADVATCAGGEICAAAETCEGGECTLICGGGTTACDAECVDTDTNPDNCGACGILCGDSEVCDAGECVSRCGGGTTECDGACVNLDSDPGNCGACGTECDPGMVCSDGECGLFCGGGTVECDGACVVIDTDPRNCGECGNACAGGEVCSDGECALSCGGGTTECDGSCVDLDTDPRNCGACGDNCEAGEACFTGECGSRPVDDTDGDTISDFDEDSGPGTDTDGDGTADFLDSDSDDDGITDAVEAGDADVTTPPVDTDRDSIPDFRDLDSDNDSLSDAEEVELGTDPTDWDTDDDGESDGVEVAGGSDPTDGDDTLEGHGDFTFDLPPGGVDRTDTLTFEPEIQRADVLFLIDTTGSMGGEINNLQTSLASTVGDIADTIPDTAFGVARFDDFPTGSYGSASCGAEADYPFELEQRVTTDLDAVEDGVAALDTPLHCGADGPESQIEALYQAATGDGFRAPAGASWADPFDGEAGFDASAGHGLIGGAGFREDALPIIVMATDNSFHRRWGDAAIAGDNATWCGDRAGDGCDYYAERFFGAAADQQPKTWAETLDALNDISAAVIGIASEGASGSDWRTELSGFAVRTGSWMEPDGAGRCPTGLSGAMRAAETYDPDGGGGDPSRSLCPLVYSVNGSGSGLSETITDAITDLVTFVHFDTLHTEARDNAATAGVDESNFFVRGIPVSADPATCDPMPSVADLMGGDGAFDSFVDVEPGCLTTFQIVARNDGFVERTCEDQIFNLDVVVIGDDVVEADRRTVVVRVPGNPSLCI